MANNNLSLNTRLAIFSSLARQWFAAVSMLILCVSVEHSFGQKPLSSNSLGKSQVAHNRVLFTDSQAAVLLANGGVNLPSPVAVGNKLTQPLGICLGVGGELFVTDTGACALIGIEASTGNQRIVSSGGLLGVPFGIAAEARGTLLVANAQVLLRIDPQTGSQKVLSAGGFFRAPLAVAVAASASSVRKMPPSSPTNITLLVVPLYCGWKTIRC